MDCQPVPLLVTGDRPDGEEDVASPGPFAPVFDQPGTGALTPLLHAALRTDALTRLVHAIRQQPHELRTHVRRTLLAHESRDVDATCAALVDLCCALGDRGEDLQRTLLARTRTTLGDEQHAVVAGMIGRGPTTAEREAVPGACLAPTHVARPLVQRAGSLAANSDPQDKDDNVR